MKLSSRYSLFVGVFFLFSPIQAIASESLFVTIDRVEIKNHIGQWISVIEPDRRTDLMTEEAAVSFFNNGRIPPGQYSNVRVAFTRENLKRKYFIERKADYSPALNIKSGSFVNISFLFDVKNSSEDLSQDRVKQINVAVDEREWTDRGEDIQLWF